MGFSVSVPEEAVWLFSNSDADKIICDLSNTTTGPEFKDILAVCVSFNNEPLCGSAVFWPVLSANIFYK